MEVPDVALERGMWNLVQKCPNMYPHIGGNIMCKSTITNMGISQNCDVMFHKCKVCRLCTQPVISSQNLSENNSNTYAELEVCAVGE